MTRLPVSRWARLPLATGTALLLVLTVPVSAWPATGTVLLDAIGTNGGHLSFTVHDPQDRRCYDINDSQFEKDANGQHRTAANFRFVKNETPTPLAIFEDDNCTGNAKATIAPGDRDYPGFKSFRVG